MGITPVSSTNTVNTTNASKGVSQEVMTLWEKHQEAVFLKVPRKSVFTTKEEISEYLKLKEKCIYEQDLDSGATFGLSREEFSLLTDMAGKMSGSKDPEISKFGQERFDELKAMAELEKQTGYVNEDRNNLLKAAQDKKHHVEDLEKARNNAGFFAKLFGNVPTDEDIAEARKAADEANKKFVLQGKQQISPRTINKYYDDKYKRSTESK